MVFVSHGKFAEGSSVGQSGEKTKSSLATLTKVADEMVDQVPGETKDTPVNEWARDEWASVLDWSTIATTATVTATTTAATTATAATATISSSRVILLR
jgi:hypothetical protein